MPTKPAHFVTQLDCSLHQKLKQDLEDQEFLFSKPIHTHFCAKKKGITLTLYTSGKLVVQGKQMHEFITYYLESELLKAFPYSYAQVKEDKSLVKPHIGVDESGKGDFFGPLCVAAVYADEAGVDKLKQMGVKDSKKLTDPQALKLAAKIKKICAYHIIRINPQKYNELIERFGNLNLLLGWGHATAIEALIDKTDCHTVVIDQFAAEHVVQNALKKKKHLVELTQRHRGEEDIVVAAASILARAEFISSLATLEKALGVKLPKGASNAVIIAGKQIVDQLGKEALAKVCKLHFKTTQKVLS